MFHLKPMKGVWASVELKKAIEKGYKIIILAGYNYKDIMVNEGLC